MKPFGSDRFGSKRWGGMRFGAGLWGLGGNVIRSINPLIWLDAADASTFTLDTGNVTQWRDKSGNGYHYYQGTDSKRPSYAANAVTFDGVDEILETLFNTNTLAITNVLFAGVVETAAKTALALLLDGYGGGASAERWGLGVDVDPGFDDKFALAHFGDSTEEGISDVLTNNVKFAFMFDYDLTADSCDVYYNGTKSTQAVAAARTFASNALMWLGGLNQGFDQWYWNGKLYELAIANYDAVEAKKVQINNYLMNKWGI